MIRWTIRILLALLLGTLTTVLIALACARWSRPTMVSMSQFSDTNPSVVMWFTARHGRDLIENDEIVPIDTDPAPKRERLWQSLRRQVEIRYPNVMFDDLSGHVGGEFIAGRGVVWISAMRWEPISAPPGLPNFQLYHMVEKQYGWPLLCLSSGDHETTWSVGNPGVIDWGNGHVDVYDRYYGDPSSGVDRMLDKPRVILWPGFIVNTLLFSTTCLFGMIGFTSARKSLRRWRGRCPICAYDLRGDLPSGCPECGWGRGTEEPRRHEGTEKE